MPPLPSTSATVDHEPSLLLFRGLGFALAGSILPWAALAYWLI